MQALNASNAVQSWVAPKTLSTDYTEAINNLRNLWIKEQAKRNLPMIQKKNSELIETSLIYLLSAAVAVGAFVLVWLISLLLGPSQT